MNTREVLVSTSLLLAGVVHALPVMGVLGSAQLVTLYGLDFSDPSLVILMRHRAVLFGLLAVFLIAAAFRRPMQLAALLAGLASTVSFLAIAWSSGNYNPAIARIVTGDVVAALLLAAGLLLVLTRERQSRLR